MSALSSGAAESIGETWKSSDPEGIRDIMISRGWTLPGTGTTSTACTMEGETASLSMAESCRATQSRKSAQVGRQVRGILRGGKAGAQGCLEPGTIYYMALHHIIGSLAHRTKRDSEPTSSEDPNEDLYRQSILHRYREGYWTLQVVLQLQPSDVESHGSLLHGDSTVEPIRTFPVFVIQMICRKDKKRFQTSIPAHS